MLKPRVCTYRAKTNKQTKIYSLQTSLGNLEGPVRKSESSRIAEEKCNILIGLGLHHVTPWSQPQPTHRTGRKWEDDGHMIPNGIRGQG